MIRARRLAANQHVLPTSLAGASPSTERRAVRSFHPSPGVPKARPSPLTSSSLNLNADDRLSDEYRGSRPRMGDNTVALYRRSLRGLLGVCRSVCWGFRRHRTTPNWKRPRFGRFIFTAPAYTLVFG